MYAKYLPILRRKLYICNVKYIFLLEWQHKFKHSPPKHS